MCACMHRINANRREKKHLMKAIDVDDERKTDEINDVTAFKDIGLRTHHNYKRNIKKKTKHPHKRFD